jgi:hypothetical protein
MKTKTKTPPHILEILRQRHGLDESDTSKDAALEAMEPMDKLRAVAGWHLGDPGWAYTFIRWGKACGVILKTSDDA